MVTAQGRPVRRAEVVASCDQDPRLQRTAVTEAEGLTPGRGADKALLLDEWEEAAGPVANKPTRKDYTYTITVTPRSGKPAQRAGFQPKESWQKVQIQIP